jgi:hypothetical protein
LYTLYRYANMTPEREKRLAAEHRYVQRLRQRCITLFLVDGVEKCQEEGCDSVAQLEFAHLDWTPVQGRGRGMKRRYLDILANPTKYKRICHECHVARDGEFYYNRFKARWIPEHEEMPF